VHVDRDSCTAKFWLHPVALTRNLGFNPRELARIERIVDQNQQTLTDSWHDYFGT
jgi:hypothetical protein